VTTTIAPRLSGLKAEHYRSAQPVGVNRTCAAECFSPFLLKRPTEARRPAKADTTEASPVLLESGHLTESLSYDSTSPRPPPRGGGVVAITTAARLWFPVNDCCGGGGSGSVRLQPDPFFVAVSAQQHRRASVLPAAFDSPLSPSRTRAVRRTQGIFIAPRPRFCSLGFQSTGCWSEIDGAQAVSTPRSRSLVAAHGAAPNAIPPTTAARVPPMRALARPRRTPPLGPTGHLAGHPSIPLPSPLRGSGSSRAPARQQRPGTRTRVALSRLAAAVR